MFLMLCVFCAVPVSLLLKYIKLLKNYILIFSVGLDLVESTLLGAGIFVWTSGLVQGLG